MIPTFLLVAIFIISGGLKISEFHPMLHHFVEMGFYPILKLLGATEIILALLILFKRTSKAGLILLTAYLSGAIAVEIPYQMMAGPALVLALVWLTAWIRNRKVFVELISSKPTQLS